MDLHALHLDLSCQRASVTAQDARGVTTRELDAAALHRVAAAAQPFLDWAHAHVLPCERSPKDATLVALSVDAIERTLRLGYLAERAAGSALPPPSSQTPVLTWCDGDYAAAQNHLREAARTAVREVNPRLPDPPGLSHDARWEHLYQHGGDGWELGRAAPPLTSSLGAYVTALPPRARALVLGCGRGHEAVLIARLAKDAGLPIEVVAVDIAPSAVRETAARAREAGVGDRITALEHDLFTLPADPAHRAGYDLAVEHCCFCAIEPSRRDEYVQTAAALLRPGARLCGLFYCHGYPGGPPFGTSAEEIRARLGPHFEITRMTVPDDSILTRAGQELFVVATRRP